MYCFCAHRGFASSCPHFSSAKAVSYPPQFTEGEAENQSSTEREGQGRRSSPEPLPLLIRPYLPGGVCRSKFQLPSTAPRPAGPGLST